MAIVKRSGSPGSPLDAGLATWALVKIKPLALTSVPEPEPMATNWSPSRISFITRTVAINSWVWSRAPLGAEVGTGVFRLLGKLQDKAAIVSMHRAIHNLFMALSPISFLRANLSGRICSCSPTKDDSIVEENIICLSFQALMDCQSGIRNLISLNYKSKRMSFRAATGFDLPALMACAFL
jgi:hypothetical protein